MQLADDIVGIFRKCDVAKTGAISTGALRQLLQMLNKDVWSDQKIDYLLSASGLERGGCIRYEDFFTWLFSSEEHALMQRSLGESAPAPEIAAARGVSATPASPLAWDDAHPLSALVNETAPAERAEAVAKFLKQQPQVASTPDAQGKLPLHLALETGQPQELTRTLLQAHPEAAGVRDRYGSLPIHSALSGNGSSNGSVADLLRAYPAGASSKDDATGMLPVHLLLMQSGPSPAQLKVVLQQLLEAYPEGSLAKAPSGDRPIQLAVYLDRGTDVFEEILKHAWKTQLSK